MFGSWQPSCLNRLSMNMLKNPWNVRCCMLFKLAKYCMHTQAFACKPRQLVVMAQNRLGGHRPGWLGPLLESVTTWLSKLRESVDGSKSQLAATLRRPARSCSEGRATDYVLRSWLQKPCGWKSQAKLHAICATLTFEHAAAKPCTVWIRKPCSD